MFCRHYMWAVTDAPMHPLLHQQSSVRPSSHYIFITSCVMCYAWSVSLLGFVFSFLQLCLLFITSQILSFFVWERNTLHFQNLEHMIGFFMPIFLLLCVLYLFIATAMFSFSLRLFQQEPWLLFSFCWNYLQFILLRELVVALSYVLS